MENGYKHYIRVNEAGIVIYGFSDAFEQPLEGDIELPGEHGRHFQLQLHTDRGQYRYRYDGELIERTQPELDVEWAERPAPPPSAEERIVQLETELAAAKNANLDTMDALFDVYLMVLDMQYGGGPA